VITDMDRASASKRTLASPSGWAEVRCFNCRRVLMKIEPGALTIDKRLEVKCPKCKLMNYPVGATT
jgi:phage FluMu protein Com